MHQSAYALDKQLLSFFLLNWGNRVRVQLGLQTEYIIHENNNCCSDIAMTGGGTQSKCDEIGISFRDGNNECFI